MKQSTRFQVFNRDGFTCQYCGRKPTEVVLEVDHIIPRKDGGKDELENLITACALCNRGKGAKHLSEKPAKVKIKNSDLKERAKQLEEYYKYQHQIEREVQYAVDELDIYWGELWDDKYSLNARGQASIKWFLTYFTMDEIKTAMAIAVARVDSVEGAFKYMCGILHNKRRDKYEGQGY